MKQCRKKKLGEKWQERQHFCTFRVRRLRVRMAEEGGGKGDGKGRSSGKGDLSVCRDFLRNVCTRGDRWVTQCLCGKDKWALV